MKLYAISLVIIISFLEAKWRPAGGEWPRLPYRTVQTEIHHDIHTTIVIITIIL